MHTPGLLASIFPAARWSRRHLLATLVVAVGVWALYSQIGPGDDFFRCYTWMVKEPERLAQVVTFPWTQNPPWLVPFMAPFVTLPGRAGYIVFLAFSLAMILFGAYLFGGKPIPILLSAHLCWILWWGQIEGWGVLGLALGWLALQKKAWPLMALALAMSAFKPQIAGVPAFALWWWSGSDRWKSLTAMLALLAFSIWVWGPWPVWYWQEIFGFVGNQHHGPWNASLGVWALPLFVPALLMPLNRLQRLLAIAATANLISPYMPYYSTIILLCFDIPWWAYGFAFLGYFPLLVGSTVAWNGIVFLPLSLLAWLYWPGLQVWLKRRPSLALLSK
jgi:hypothetical protein